jgi:hypothetical protein
MNDPELFWNTMYWVSVGGFGGIVFLVVAHLVYWQISRD